MKYFKYLQNGIFDQYLKHNLSNKKLKKIIPRYEKQGSDFSRTGIHAAPDWRYELLVDYLKLSPSYRLVCRGGYAELKPSQLPKDWKQVLATYSDFGNVYKIRESQWWPMVGRHLFGVKAAKSETFTLGTSAKELVSEVNLEAARQRWSEMAEPQSLVIAIPMNQTKLAALRQIREILKATEFNGSAASIKPKYTLLPSKLREFTLAHGVTALKAYKSGVPLWKIGYSLGLSEASCQDFDTGTEMALAKSYLSILASKLIHKAELIAENAARGRFPSDKSFPEAILVSNQRKVGRPKKS